MYITYNKHTMCVGDFVVCIDWFDAAPFNQVNLSSKHNAMILHDISVRACCNQFGCEQYEMRHEVVLEAYPTTKLR